MRCSSLPIVSRCRGSARLPSYGSETSRLGTAKHDAFRQKVVHHGRVDIKSITTRYALTDDEVREMIYDLNNITLNIPEGALVLADNKKLTALGGLLSGTPDLAIFKDAVLTVVDWKSGWGEVEEPSRNGQMLGYGVLCVEDWLRSLGLEVREIRLIIVQPRLNSVRSATITPADLAERAKDLRTIIEEAQRPDADLTTGPWCSSCFKSMSCPAFAGQVVSFAGMTIVEGDPKALAPVLAKALPIAKACASMIRKVEALAQAYVDKHGELDLGAGQKYVKAIGSKKVLDPLKAIPVVKDLLGVRTAEVISVSKSKIEAIAREIEKGLAPKVIKALTDGGAFNEEMTITYRVIKGGDLNGN